MKILSALLIIIAAANQAHAAAGAGTIWWVSPTGTAANVNGGGFNPLGTAFATDLTATSATGTTPVVSSASYTFVTADASPVPGAGTAGAYLWIKASGAWGTSGQLGCFYPITSASAGAATLNAAIGAGWCLDATQGNPSPYFKVTTVAGIANTGSPSGGTFGLDYSHGDLAICAAGDLTTSASSNTLVTSSSCSFGKNHVHNILQIESAGGGVAYTQEWYEVTAVSGGVATLDRTNGTTTGSTGTFKLGGAISMGSTTTNRTDSNFLGTGTHLAAGNRIMVLQGAYTIAATLAAGQAGSTTVPIAIEGYAAVPGDTPTGDTRPFWNFGVTAFTMTTATNVDLYNLVVTGAGATLLTTGTSSKILNCKVINHSTTAGRVALQPGSNSLTLGNEAISYRGTALSPGANVGVIKNNYIHDSDILMSSSAVSNLQAFVHNIFVGGVSNALKFTAAATSIDIDRNTIVGFVTPTGTGISLITGATNIRVRNSIIDGFVTGISHADAANAGYSNRNDMFNNTTNVANWIIGQSSLTLDPQFTSFAEYTNQGTVTSSTNVLTDSGATFTNVVDGRDHVYITAATGTGATAGIYPISAHTPTTLTLALTLGSGSVTFPITSSGSGSAITYRLLYGRNFAVGTNLQNAGSPSVFPGGLTTGYSPIGAVGSQVSSGGGTRSY